MGARACWAATPLVAMIAVGIKKRAAERGGLVERLGKGHAHELCDAPDRVKAEEEKICEV